jgi:hypothetical protein
MFVVRWSRRSKESLRATLTPSFYFSTRLSFRGYLHRVSQLK